MPYTTVQPPRWSSVYIIAGGPSARRFDLSSLGGKRVLAVNDGLWLAATVAHILAGLAVFSLDHRWVRRYKTFLGGFTGEKYIALPPGSWPVCEDVPGVRYLQWGHENGLSEDPALVNTGGNSGYGAIGLAYLKGAREIHLVGYDMDASATAHTPGISDAEKFRQWIPRFRTMLPQLAARGVRVVNHNPESAIDAFEKSTMPVSVAACAAAPAEVI